MAEFIDFLQSTKKYSEVSIENSIDGDYLKAILYADFAMRNSNKVDEKIRYIDAIYESGNFNRALDLYLELYFSGVKTRTVYDGIISGLYDVGKLQSSAFFLEEGIRKNIIKEDIVDMELVDYVPLYVSSNHYRGDGILSGKRIYMFVDFLSKGDDAYFSDKFFSENTGDKCDASDYMSVFSKDVSFNKKEAVKLLEMYHNAFVNNSLTSKMMAIVIHALVLLNRMEEAYGLVESIKESEMPEDAYDLVNYIFAFICVNDHVAVAKYTAELLEHCNNEHIMFMAVIANINLGNYDLACEMITYIFRVAPNHPIAKYFIRVIRDKSVCKEYKYISLLPEDEMSLNLKKIDDVFANKVKVDNSAEQIELFNWALRYNTTATALVVGREMINQGIYIDLIKNLLISYTVEVEVKRRLLACCLKNKPKKKIDIFVSSPVQASFEYLPSGMSEKELEVYANTYAVLTYYNNGQGEKKVSQFYSENKWYDELSELHLSVDMLSAYVIVKSKVSNMPLKKLAVIMNFSKLDNAMMRKIVKGAKKNV